MTRRILGLTSLIFAASVLLGGAAWSPWEHVPAKDHARVNPLAGRADSAAAGSLVYKEHCAQCHHSDAMGDGRKKPPLRSDRIRAATDGDLEWFLRQGNLRRGMPSWSRLPEAQRWQLITYLRSVQ